MVHSPTVETFRAIVITFFGRDIGGVIADYGEYTMFELMLLAFREHDMPPRGVASIPIRIVPYGTISRVYLNIRLPPHGRRFAGDPHDHRMRVLRTNLLGLSISTHRRPRRHAWLSASHLLYLMVHSSIPVVPRIGKCIVTPWPPLEAQIIDWIISGDTPS